MSTAATTAAGRWTLDPQASTASFIAPHLRSGVQGSIPFRAATVEFGNQGEVVRATAELELTAIDTGNPRRDRDLAKPHLLNTHHFPILAVTMDSCSTTATGWTAQVTIAARGRTCPASLIATRICAATDSTLRTRIQGSFDRSLLGLHIPGIIIGRQIRVELFAEFRAAPNRP